MKKTHVCIALIVLLVVLNIAQLGAHFIFPKPPHVGSQNFKAEIPKILDLDEDQARTFFKLASNHRDQINVLQKQQHELTLNYINSPSDALLDDIAKLHKEKIVLTKNHFNDVYGILNDSQKAHFLKFKQAAFQVINR